VLTVRPSEATAERLARLSLPAEYGRVRRHEWLVEDDHVTRAVEEKEKPGGPVRAIPDAVLDLGRNLDQHSRPDRSRLTVHFELQLALKDEVDLIDAVVVQRDSPARLDLGIGDRGADYTRLGADRKVEADTLARSALRPGLHELE